MILLSIETSGMVCGVAVSDDTGGTFALRAATELLIPNAHDGSLARITDSTLREAGHTIRDVDLIAVSAGPGSFTGLRIGASFAKGLCFDGSARLLGVPTMTSLAVASSEVARIAERVSVLCVVASHRDLVYVQRFGVDATPLDEVRVTTIDDARGLVSDRDMIVGPGAGLITDAPISGLSRCSPRFVALAASIMLRDPSVRFDDPMTFEPGYRQDFIPKS